MPATFIWPDDREALKEHLRTHHYGQAVRCKVTMPDGHTWSPRLFLSSHDMVCEAYRRRRYGAPVRYPDGTVIQVPVPRPKKDFAEAKAHDIRKWARYVLTHLHPNLWPEMREAAESVTEERLAEFVSLYRETGDWWTALDLMGWKLRPWFLERHKSTTLRSHGVPSYVQEAIRRSLDTKTPGDWWWRDKYDCSVRVWTDASGHLNATFAAEYRNMGNGHYYYLISDNNAVFAETD